MANPVKLNLQPVTHREANAYIEQHHRHHDGTRGMKFAIAVNDGERVRGVVVLGRPVARMLDDGFTAEVLRCCTDGARNACSKLYAAAWRCARAMGYRRLITYVLDTETGSSVRSAGFRLVGEAGGGSWNREGRPRVDTHPTQRKLLFERGAVS